MTTPLTGSALPQRIRRVAFAVLLGAAATLTATSPANAASLVQCESEGGYFDCYLPSGYASEVWYLDGTHVAGADNASSMGGSCVVASRHNVRVTFSGPGSSTTNFTCK
ncbi:hypothetical protein [Hamadaea tsunoensis]|uniref:hypothetical protein n=1 Tax=Hamadaea tsunoensis TaxID=53368 RepID=UPI0012F7A9D3|nr:hypothetical protein [Hamadaea tsunoensis]